MNTNIPQGEGVHRPPACDTHVFRANSGSLVVVILRWEALYILLCLEQGHCTMVKAVRTQSDLSWELLLSLPRPSRMRLRQGSNK